jgi:hypothetical protein
MSSGRLPSFPESIEPQARLEVGTSHPLKNSDIMFLWMEAWREGFPLSPRLVPLFRAEFHCALAIVIDRRHLNPAPLWSTGNDSSPAPADQLLSRSTLPARFKPSQHFCQPSIIPFACSRKLAAMRALLLSVSFVPISISPLPPFFSLSPLAALPELAVSPPPSSTLLPRALSALFN